MNHLKRLYGIVLVFVPVILFAIIYFALGKYPNYLVNSVDTEGLWNAEKSLFGITTMTGSVLTPQEYCALHHCALFDILSGCFYLLWLPMPFLYFLVLYLQGHKQMAVRATSAFLTVNLVGFLIYYIHPASPPWYIMQYGFDVNFHTPGNVAGFQHFDDILGVSIFHGIYAKNANVFASMPSLHAAYTPVALYYAFKIKHNTGWRIALSIVSVGIWCSAVYSGHHYIIDVVCGVATTAVGIFLFEYIISRTSFWRWYASKVMGLNH